MYGLPIWAFINALTYPLHISLLVGIANMAYVGSNVILVLLLCNKKDNLVKVFLFFYMYYSPFSVVCKPA